MSLRADEEQAGGIIHKPMFERLILCEFTALSLPLAEITLPLNVAAARGLPMQGLDGGGGRSVDWQRTASTLMLICQVARA